MLNFAFQLIALALAPFGIFLALKRPLLFPLGLYVMLVPFDPLLGQGGATITRGVALLSAAALIFHIIAHRRLLAPPKSWVAWAAFVLWAALTALVTIDPANTLLSFTQLIQLFLFYTVLAVYPVRRDELRTLAVIVVASGVTVAGYGFYLYLQGTRFAADRLTLTDGTGAYIDPNHLGAALLLPIALAVGTFIETKNILLRFAAGASLTIMAFGLFLTGSRGALVALAIMMVYIGWQTRYRLQILALLSIFGLLSLMVPTIWTRFADPTQGAGSGRLFIWNAAFRGFSQFWLTGAGLGSFPAVYNRELLSIYQQVFQGWSRPAHNILLGIAIELGLLGVTLLVYAWWRSWADARGNVVIEAAIIALLVASLFLDTLLFKYLWLAFSMAALVKNAADPRFLRGTHQVSAPNRAALMPRRIAAWRRLGSRRRV
jgi:putative inorganic carbon (HCO3(-)) transporter